MAYKYPTVGDMLLLKRYIDLDTWAVRKFNHKTLNEFSYDLLIQEIAQCIDNGWSRKYPDAWLIIPNGDSGGYTFVEVLDGEDDYVSNVCIFEPEDHLDDREIGYVLYEDIQEDLKKRLYSLRNGSGKIGGQTRTNKENTMPHNVITEPGDYKDCHEDIVNIHEVDQGYAFGVHEDSACEEVWRCQDGFIHTPWGFEANTMAIIGKAERPKDSLTPAKELFDTLEDLHASLEDETVTHAQVSKKLREAERVIVKHQNTYSDYCEG